MSIQVGELALNELKVQCEDCCSQIFIFTPNKFVSLSLLKNGNTTNSSFYRNIICTHIIHNWQISEDKIVHSHTNNMTVELYQQHMINRNGCATATEIETAE
jgi:hypothetical protein